MDELDIVTDEPKPEPILQSAELPDVVEIGIIELQSGIPFYYEAWGIHYMDMVSGDWEVVNMAFRKKSDAQGWVDTKYSTIQGEVIPVTRTLWLDGRGNINTKTEEST